MKWKFLEKEKDVFDYTRQVDTVGNIVQEKGAIEPKACQKCKVKFETHLEYREIKKDVPIYLCDCEWKNASGDAAFDHMLTTKEHTLKKTNRKRKRNALFRTIGFPIWELRAGVRRVLEGLVSERVQEKGT